MAPTWSLAEATDAARDPDLRHRIGPAVDQPVVVAVPGADDPDHAWIAATRLVRRLGTVVIGVGDRIIIAHKDTGCFPNVDVVMPELRFPTGDPFRLTLSDSDERLIEPIGSKTMPPFAGGYDLVRSRSMERIEMMFGGYGSEPQAWHYYTPLLNESEDVENNDLVAIGCREGTLASPGRANSPDYSGAFAAGNLE